MEKSIIGPLEQFSYLSKHLSANPRELIVTCFNLVKRWRFPQASQKDVMSRFPPICQLQLQTQLEDICSRSLWRCLKSYCTSQIRTQIWASFGVLAPDRIQKAESSSVLRSLKCVGQLSVSLANTPCNHVWQHHHVCHECCVCGSV